MTKDPFVALSLAAVEPVMLHLTVKEILDMSEVSKDWYKKTAQLESFVRRLKVVVKCSCGLNKEKCDGNSALTVEAVSLILQSTRKFQTLEVQLCWQCLNIIQDLFLDEKHRQRWKNVAITHSQFELIAKLAQYLVSIEEDVETMTLRYITVSQEDDFDIEGPWKFRKLKVLTIKNCHSQTLQFCFKNCESLEKFNFTDGSLEPDSDPMHALIRVLQQNESLNALTIGGNVFFGLMERFRGCELFSSIKFRLQMLTASSYYSPTLTWAYETFAEFVRSQSGSLLSIEFNRFMGFPAICAAFDCPRLIHLALHGNLVVEEASEWRHYVLYQSKSIWSLMLCIQPTGFDAGLFQDVLEAAPNARHLCISRMNDSLLEHVTTAMPNLENILIDNLSISMDTIMRGDYLPELNALHILKCSIILPAGIQRRCGRQRTNFQRLFHQFFYNWCTNSNATSGLEIETYTNIITILGLLE